MPSGQYDRKKSPGWKAHIKRLRAKNVAPPKALAQHYSEEAFDLDGELMNEVVPLGTLNSLKKDPRKILVQVFNNITDVDLVLQTVIDVYGLSKIDYEHVIRKVLEPVR